MKYKYYYIYFFFLTLSFTFVAAYDISIGRYAYSVLWFFNAMLSLGSIFFFAIKELFETNKKGIEDIISKLNVIVEHIESECIRSSREDYEKKRKLDELKDEINKIKQ